LIQTNTSAATAITNLAAIIATNFPTINATMGNGTISLTSYGTPIGVTTAGQWATNAVTTNATPATLAITAFGLLASAQTYPIPGLSFNHTVGATITTNVNGTNTLGAWQQIRYQIVSYSTNGVVPGWNFETGTK
jgi:hypothetical protein